MPRINPFARGLKPWQVGIGKAPEVVEAEVALEPIELNAPEPTHGGERQEAHGSVAIKCEPCEAGASSIPGRTAPGDLLGTCARCGVLACDAHANRDPHAPAYHCVQCDPGLLTVSGLAHGGTASVVAALMSAAFYGPDGAAPFESLNEFLDYRPDYYWLPDMVEEVRRALPEGLSIDHNRRLWESLDDSGQELIAAAIALVQRFELPTRILPEGLNVLIRDWNPDWT